MLHSRAGPERCFGRLRGPFSLRLRFAAKAGSRQTRGKTKTKRKRKTPFGFSPGSSRSGTCGFAVEG
eukprot:7925338-Pyramimonas_sp.AAC.1